ncbi:hypothetical protein K7432_012180 [Basidiobolus ranarum]|uniref:Uncharacterized protein n=1 Tax=Basidiobolus ranarum TaxID=34480 RepID=A0ABR2VSP1_9FUNG
MALDDRTKALLSTFMLLWMKNNELICNQSYVDSSSDSDSDISTDFSDSESANLEELSDTDELLYEEYRSLQEQQRKMQYKAQLRQELEARNTEIKIENENDSHQPLEEKLDQEEMAADSVLQNQEETVAANVLSNQEEMITANVLQNQEDMVTANVLQNQEDMVTANVLQNQEEMVTANVLQKRSMLLDEEDYDEPLENEVLNKKRKTE